ncbi:hypothetical protein F5888DRAFT_1804273 [Russula emetica]|nr:hypothetical protein F5888DRAFT_1804273 [Russula emetica]
MSQNNPPPTATQIHLALQAVGRSIEAASAVPGTKVPITQMLTNFAKIYITPIVAQDQLYPSCPPPTQPSNADEELRKIQTSLQASVSAAPAKARLKLAPELAKMLAEPRRMSPS